MSSSSEAIVEPAHVEHAGVERLDESVRTATPWTFATVNLGASVALASVIYGWLPITFGLGLGSTVTAIVAGTAVGTFFVLPMIMLGSRTATNNPTASGAEFGVRGRLLGSTLGLLTTILSAALVIWTGGGATVGALNRLFDMPRTDLALAISYGVLTLACVLIAIYGFRLLARASLVVVIVGGVLTALMPIALAGDVNLSYSGGGEYLLGGFWKTWLLAALVVGVAGIMAVSPILGDWTRYISSERYPARKLLPVAGGAIVVGFIVPPSIGAIASTAFADPFAPFAVSLAADAPTWYVALLLPLALIGSLGYASATLYSTGLDLDALIAPLRRTQTTILGSAVATALVFLGSLTWDASEAIAGALLILLALIAPWAAIVSVGYLRRRGEYDLDDLQVFNRRQTGGAYWYDGGFNWRALVAWAAGATFGVLAVQTTFYTGPIADLGDGIDVSFVGSFGIAALLFLAIGRVSPSGASSRSVEPTNPLEPVPQET